MENQLDGELVKEIQVVQERKKKEKERSPDNFPSKKLCHEGANRGLSERLNPGAPRLAATAVPETS